MAAQHAGQSGFFLPLSFGVGLVLLLSSLSLQTAALHGHRQMAGQWRQRQASDALASAAQQVAAQLHGPYRCLLQVPSSQWPPAGCGAGASLAGLREGEVGSSRYRLVEWWPAPGPAAEPVTALEARLRLELGGEETGSRAQALFGLRLDPDRPERLLTVRRMGR
ncbi:hypothetical protein KQ302_03990 [Synechococcus sp. CS-602]|uniref:hypothetical protein n=1 Tax=Synechococcaceae TaxID=1890426 RepID=UPI0008FF49B0|nr:MULTISPECIES: hypothetical protein [Synechococcaceae]MCT4365405.1 hypothetical protein [Candidatus Regnicoccus frigidus MAG-AL1]APD47555.1 hypothetical protein BM449_03730 [Synechococcus sp. SynAce01]MCT0202469.1 hypothetical protein [Synechococcus sp. CS-603]MCT0204275.1 hypothetical protein [Synechococcus sp. CS-602]MCT0247116.1 hypothetical protein [Synechococcus sp. CS-601]